MRSVAPNSATLNHYLTRRRALRSTQIKSEKCSLEELNATLWPKGKPPLAERVTAPVTPEAP
jgi:hypothetical protein